MSELVRALLALAEAAETVAQKTSYIEAAKSAAESEKLVAEAAKLREDAANTQRLARADERRFTITVVAPLISALAVVLALGVQIFQANLNVRMQRELSQASSIRDAIKSAGSRSDAEVASGVLLLISMIDSPTYGRASRAISFNILTHIAEPKTFEILFDALTASGDDKTLADVVRLSRMFGRALSSLRAQMYPNASVTPPLGGASTTPRISGLPNGVSAEEFESALDDEVTYSGAFIVRYIRAHGTAAALDLSGAWLIYQDLRNTDFGHANVNGVDFFQANIEGADFSQTDSFEHSDWEAVEWWRAKHISLKLLDYLADKYPYDTAKTYGAMAAKSTTTPQQYQDAVARLRSVK